MRNANARLADIQAAKVADWPNHPEAFIEDILDDHLWSREEEILKSAWKYRQTFVQSGNSVGKTFIAARIALAFLFAYSPLTGYEGGTKVIIVGTKFESLRKQVWAELGGAYYNARFPLGGILQAHDLVLAPNWFAGIFGADKDSPERVQGYHAENFLAIIEEATGVSDEVYEAIESCATSKNAHILAIANPLRLSGFFYEACVDPKNDLLKEQGLRNTIKVSSLEVPNVIADKEIYPGLATREWVEEKKQKWGEASPMYQARVLGEFPQAAEDAVIPWETIEAACSEERLAQIRPDEELKVVSMDIARGGDDSVIMALWGDYVYGIRAKKTPNTNEATDWFKEAHRDWGGKAAIDENGLGGGPYDRLRDEHLPIRGFVSQRKARNNERFANLKAETLWSLRERFIEEQIAIPDSRYRDRLKNDLGGYRWKPDMKGRVQIIDPPKSPDYGDALVIAHWRQTASQMNISIHSGGKTLAGDYRNKKF